MMRRGFTLLELLLVVFILAAIAAAGVSLVGDVDTQARFDLTKLRRDQVRDAILGKERSINGTPVVSGFVADMGRLPLNLRELMLPNFDDLDGDLTDDDGTLVQWGSDPTFTHLRRGWRGPYLPLQLEDGFPTFRDGWSNRPFVVSPLGDTSLDQAEDQLWCGWHHPSLDPNAFDLVSLGRDNAIDTLLPGSPALPEADQDFPAYSGSASDDHLRIVTPADWLVELDQHTVEIESGEEVMGDLTLTVRYPVVKDTAMWETVTVPLTGVTIPAGASSHTFQFASASRAPVGRWEVSVQGTLTDSGGSAHSLASVGGHQFVNLRPRSVPVWPSRHQLKVTP